MNEQAAIWESIDALSPWKDNPRKNKGAISHVAESIKRFGFASPIIARSADKTIIAGHTRYEAAKKLGLEKIPVRYLDLDPADSRLLALADNKIGEIAEWDEDKLEKVMQDLLDEGISLDDIGWSDDELGKIVDELKQEEIKEDEAPDEEDIISRVKKGDVWLLGDHRLLCGDSTEEKDIDKLVEGKKIDMIFTDPPYALFGNSTGVSGIVDDKMVMPFFKDIFYKCKKYTKRYAHIYVFCDWHSCNAINSAAIYRNLPAKNLIVWDKGDGGVGGMYQNCHELIWFFNNVPKQKYTHTSSGKTTGARTINGVPNIWRFSRVGKKERIHNAQKPVELVCRAIECSSDKEETVLDLFGGSGTTLIAAEHKNRKCYMMEFDEKNCDKIIARWEKLTGATAQKEEKE